MQVLITENKNERVFRKWHKAVPLTFPIIWLGFYNLWLDGVIRIMPCGYLFTFIELNLTVHNSQTKIYNPGPGIV